MKEYLADYVNRWKSNKNVIGILLSGSYATELYTKNSDIDLRIIYAKDEKHNYKGVDTIDDYKYSYITGTVDDYLRMMHNQFYRCSKFEARVFAVGKILYDKTGEIKALQDKASGVMNLAFEDFSSDLLQLKKYMLTNDFLSFTKKEVRDPLFKYYYFQFLDHAFKAYSFYLRFEVPVLEKLNRILFDATYRNKNNFEAFPDEQFLALWKEAINASIDEYIDTAKSIFNHVEENWGPFDVYNFNAKI